MKGTVARAQEALRSRDFRRLFAIGWPRRMMALTLAHDYDMVPPVMERSPLARQVATLDDLATLLWDPDAPGLPA